MLAVPQMSEKTKRDVCCCFRLVFLVETSMVPWGESPRAQLLRSLAPSCWSRKREFRELGKEYAGFPCGILSSDPDWTFDVREGHVRKVEPVTPSHCLSPCRACC